MSDERIILTLTMDQARAVKDMLDFAGRVSMGQFGEIEQRAARNQVGWAVEPAKVSFKVERARQLRRCFDEAREIMGFAQGESLGLGDPRLPQSVHRAYEVEKVLAKALASDDFGVDGDGLIVRYTSDPAPIARRT